MGDDIDPKILDDIMKTLKDKEVAERRAIQEKIKQQGREISELQAAFRLMFQDKTVLSIAAALVNSTSDDALSRLIHHLGNIRRLRADLQMGDDDGKDI